MFGKKKSAPKAPSESSELNQANLQSALDYWSNMGSQMAQQMAQQQAAYNSAYNNISPFSYGYNNSGGTGGNGGIGMGSGLYYGPNMTTSGSVGLGTFTGTVTNATYSNWPWTPPSEQAAPKPKKIEEDPDLYKALDVFFDESRKKRTV